MARPDLIAPGGRPRAARHGWIASGLACLLGTAQAGCMDAVAADVGALHSRWDEIGAQGQRLVRERGTLAAAAIELDTHCLPGRWALRLEHAQGERAYAGQSTTGTPIRSTSHLSLDRLQLQWRLPWRAGFSLEARAGAEQLRREIDSVGRIAGYPERFGHLHAAIGLRHDATPAPGLRLALAGWLGGGPRGWLDLHLPGTDAATLRLGASRLAGASAWFAAAGEPPAAAWHWQGGLDCQWQRFGAGPAHAITRQGVPVGGATQPETRTAACTAALRLAYRFD